MCLPDGVINRRVPFPYTAPVNKLLHYLLKLENGI